MLNDFPNPFGVPRQQMAGLPRFNKAEFIGEYPFTRVILKDKNVPLKAELEAYNPFIPLSPDNSGLPVAIFKWSLKNRTSRQITASLCFNMGNPLNPAQRSRSITKGAVVNEIVRTQKFQGVQMRTHIEKDSVEYGEIILFTP